MLLHDALVHSIFMRACRGGELLLLSGDDYRRVFAIAYIYISGASRIKQGLNGEGVTRMMSTAVLQGKLRQPFAHSVWRQKA